MYVLVAFKIYDMDKDGFISNGNLFYLFIGFAPE